MAIVKSGSVIAVFLVYNNNDNNSRNNGQWHQCVYVMWRSACKINRILY